MKTSSAFNKEVGNLVIFSMPTVAGYMYSDLGSTDNRFERFERKCDDAVGSADQTEDYIRPSRCHAQRPLFGWRKGEGPRAPILSGVFEKNGQDFVEHEERRIIRLVISRIVPRAKAYGADPPFS